MKKISLALTLVLVLGFASAASAQQVTSAQPNCSESTPGAVFFPDSVGGGVWACPSTATPTAAPAASSIGDYVPVVTIPGLTNAGSNLVTTSTLANFLNNLYKYLVGLAATLAVLEIIWGGIKISMQSDSISEHSAGVEKIKNALGGLALVLLPALVFSIINPGILNLSLNIPPLDTKAGTYVPSENIVGSTTATVNIGSVSQGQIIRCNGTNCTAEMRLCSGASALNFSVATPICWNPSTQKQDPAPGGANPAQITCPDGEVPSVVCTVTSVNAGF